MSLICSYGSCSDIPEFYCKCKKLDFFCKFHADLHSSEDESTHDLESAFLFIPTSEKGKSITLLKDLIQESDDFLSEITVLTQKIMKMSEDSIKKLSGYKKLLKWNLKELIQNNRVFSAPETEKLATEEKVYETLMQLKTQFFRNENLRAFGTKLKRNLKYFQEIYNYYSKDSHERFVNRNLCFFVRNSNKIVHFDAFKQSFKSFEVESIQTQGCLASICFVNSKSVFCYGGHSINDKSEAFFINVENRCVKILPKGVPRSCASAQYWNNRVYVFGGYSTSIMKRSHYFDLINESWVPIAGLPSFQQDTSTVSVSGKIVISGYTDFLYAYDIKENNYLKCCDHVKISYSNILIPYLNNIILLMNRLIYIAGKSDLFNWTVHSCLCSFEQTTSKPAVRGKYAYFYTMTNDIYRFDCESFCLIRFNHE
jgi:hypothetical protein